MECALCKVQYVGKAETGETTQQAQERCKQFKIYLCQFTFQKTWTLIEQIRNTHTTNKGTLKFRLKRGKEFWIQKLETLTHKRLNQELNV